MNWFAPSKGRRGSLAVNLQEIAGMMRRTGVVYPCLVFSLAVLLVVTFSSRYSSNSAVPFVGADTKSLIKVFSSSEAAVRAGFQEQDTLALAGLPFFEAYSQLVARLSIAKKRSQPGTINYLAAAAVFAINAAQQEQRAASLKAFFRYYPDVIDDSTLFCRVVVLSGALSELEKSSPLRQEIRQAAWKLAGAAIERNVASGTNSLPELAELTALFPELDAMVRNSLNPPPVIDQTPLIHDVSPVTEPEDAI